MKTVDCIMLIHILRKGKRQQPKTVDLIYRCRDESQGPTEYHICKESAPTLNNSSVDKDENTENTNIKGAGIRTF